MGQNNCILSRRKLAVIEPRSNHSLQYIIQRIRTNQFHRHTGTCTWAGSLPRRWRLRNQGIRRTHKVNTCPRVRVGEVVSTKLKPSHQSGATGGLCLTLYASSEGQRPHLTRSSTHGSTLKRQLLRDHVLHCFFYSTIVRLSGG
jgi:hypothetical protein